MSQPTASDIQTIFNRIAPVYDELNDRLSFGMHHVWKLMTVKWCHPVQGGKGLDLCCGSGDLTLLLAEAVGPQGQVYGVDFSCELLAVAQERSQQTQPPMPISWLQGDALDLPFPDDFFDCATMGYGLRNVTDIPQALRELHRVLKPGSTAAILDFHRPEQPLFQTFQQWYLEKMVVPTAQGLGLTEEYAYIGPSLDRFPQGQEQVKLATEAGFSQAVHYKIAFGLMGVLQITKS